MKNIVDHPQNKAITTVYLLEDNIKDLEKLSTMTGLSRSQLVRMMIEHCLPKAKMTRKTMYSLSFD